MNKLLLSSGCALLLACTSCDQKTSGPSQNSGGSSTGATNSGGGPFDPGSGGEASGAGGNVTGGGGSTGGENNTGGATGGTPGGGSSAGGSESSGGTTSGDGGSGPLGEYPTPDCGAPKDLGVRVVGRHDGCDSAGVRMAWSGTGFVAKIDGTGLRITQTGPAVHYTVVADQMVMPEFVSPDGNQSSDVVTGLPAGEHIIEVYRQGEASFGETTLTKVEAIDGSMLPPPPAPQRRIEIFGDSITAGYGNEGTSTDCPFSAETENHYLTYGALLARQFNAELSTVAWSGKGIVSNYGGDKSTFLPQMLDRAIPSSETSVWDYSLAAPAQLVIVNLGTNDYSTDNDPTTADFVAGYTAMLQTIRTRYPGAFILCTNGPLLSGEDLSTVRTNIQAAVDQLSSGGDSAIRAFELQPENPSPGCDWHPSLATHEAMAAELATPIQSFLGW